VLRADPPGSAFSHRRTGFAGFLGQEPVAELGIVAMSVE
jgi:hypothetical protein